MCSMPGQQCSRPCSTTALPAPCRSVRAANCMDASLACLHSRDPSLPGHSTPSPSHPEAEPGSRRGTWNCRRSSSTQVTTEGRPSVMPAMMPVCGSSPAQPHTGCLGAALGDLNGLGSATVSRSATCPKVAAHPRYSTLGTQAPIGCLQRGSSPTAHLACFGTCMSPSPGGVGTRPAGSTVSRTLQKLHPSGPAMHRSTPVQA